MLVAMRTAAGLALTGAVADCDWLTTQEVLPDCVSSWCKFMALHPRAPLFLAVPCQSCTFRDGGMPCAVACRSPYC